MNNSRSTADRVRPILQAMERSIDQARNRRLHHDDAPMPPRPVPAPPPVRNNDTNAARRKARPKRATPMMRPFDGSEYRAEIV